MCRPRRRQCSRQGQSRPQIGLAYFFAIRRRPRFILDISRVRFAAGPSVCPSSQCQCITLGVNGGGDPAERTPPTTALPPWRTPQGHLRRGASFKQQFRTCLQSRRAIRPAVLFCRRRAGPIRRRKTRKPLSHNHDTMWKRCSEAPRRVDAPEIRILTEAYNH